ncbi:MAG: tRNA (adenosine(37)-N6)-threonylcarbamoyltransferase complex dimerization subunit type 1 TsaB [PVC group bacterium]|nr:tRNA (adenosine(37)-N6)-threonylcarbamoyltransferase complex dimerization subunit type 1 TsaB [PVC group bacterium]
MKYLSIDTSTKYLCIVVGEDGKVLRSYNRVQGRAHSQHLIPGIEKVLKQAGCRMRDMDFFSIDKGPGSFTGIRIGLAAVKGLSLAVGKPVVSFSCLDVLAWNLPAEKITICPIIDAKRGQVYSTFLNLDKGTLQREGDYFLGPIDDLLKKIKFPAVFTGDAIDLYKDRIKTELKHKSIFAKEKFWYPNTQAISRLSFDLYQQGEFKKAEELSPLYLYADTCTINKAKGKKQK